MPKSNHKTLIRVLLWWVTLLSICQAALLVLFFTMGHFGKNGDAQRGPKHIHSDQLASPKNTTRQDKARMFTYEASRVDLNSIIWSAVYSEDPVRDGNVVIQNDGYFFVCLRITLQNSTCRSQDRCSKVEVTLKEVNENGDILTGWINNDTLSTGLLCKMKKLLVGDRLSVQVKIQPSESIHINKKRSLSSLDLVYMPNLP
ncbi:uncharacterized protein LOC129456426 [Periophthalmus magnuspinnatus]|uniref:uncharacterized protein LOC129456426 n=1 Tax=Periophthalmus magnuspinnatus TaxID=409849 RepID=UPI0024364970|nr:uncharacterized protein LOC129456426 [Periophthalmus magnuspinnatus]